MKECNSAGSVARDPGMLNMNINMNININIAPSGQSSSFPSPSLPPSLLLLNAYSPFSRSHS